MSHLKASAAEVLSDMAERRAPMVIAQNSEAKTVPRGVASCEQTQKTLARPNCLAIGSQVIEAGRTKLYRQVVDRMRTLARKPG